MDSVYLKNLTNKSLQSVVPADKNAPLTFLQWREQSPAVPSQDETYHYNQYIIDWFSKNKTKAISSQFVLRQKYLFLLQQLQAFFTEEEKTTWYNQINFADERELLTAIPYFARKLRDIAIYYLNLRKALKNTKVKYNTVGTTKAIEHEIYSYLLNALSPENIEHSPELLTLTPSFSSLQRSLVVKVDELYDDNQYFDWSPTASLSSYVNILDAATATFFQTKGITLSSDGWIFNTFNLPVTGDLNTLVDRLTGNVFETTDVALYGSFIQNYLSENKYNVTYTTPPTSVLVSNIPLSAGNNRFFYPYGIVDPTLTTEGQLEPVSLSSIQTAGAASGTTLETSDSVFVKYGNDIKGAWYRYVDYNKQNETMESYIEHNATTTFVYPYPGYGLSAEEFEWTGPGLVYDPQYPFLSKSLKANIQNQYWSTPLSTDSCEDVYLNDTTAILDGANASDNFNKADKIYLRDRNMVYDTALPVRELSGAWLYKFTETALPISPNQPNVIVWPYDIVDTTLIDLPDYLQNQNFQDVCKPISITDLDTSYFIAASSIDLADRIYKLRYFTDNEQTDALECSWLSGSIDSVGINTFVVQDGLTLSLSAGQVTRFVWTGPDNTPLSSVFIDIPHQADCPFVTSVSSVSAYEWQKCTCKQVYYSPLGQSGYRFTDNNSMADFVVEDTSTGIINFNLATWTDLSGNDILNSPLFAWYNTYNSNGWGYGRWTSLTTVSGVSGLPGTPNPNTLALKYGHAYFYGRANSNLTSTPFPQYNVLKSFNTKKTAWVEAAPNTNKNGWYSNNTAASTQINAGDFLKVVRQQQTTSFYLSSVSVPSTSYNNGSVWTTYDVVALSDNPLLNSTVVAWPQTTKVQFNDQYPSISLNTLLTPIYPDPNLTFAQLTALLFSLQTPLSTSTPAPSCVYVAAHTDALNYAFGGSGSFTVEPGISSIVITGVGGGGGGGSAEEVNAGGGGGGGGGGGIFSDTFTNILSGDIVSYSVGAGGAGSRASGRGQTSGGSSGGSTTITITRPNVGVIYSKTAGGGGGGGGGSDRHGGGGGGGGYPGGNPGGSGQSGTNDRSSCAGGGGGSSPYAGYGAGGAGASSRDRTNPLYWNGAAGSGGVAAFSMQKFVPTLLAPSAPLIILNGKSTMSLQASSAQLSSIYIEPYATVYDGKDYPNGGQLSPSSGSVNIKLSGTYILTYSYTNTLGISATPVTRTVNVYNPSVVPPGVPNKPQVLRWNVVNVQTSATQSFYNTSVFSFTPNTTGTFYLEVTGRDTYGNYLYLYGASSPNLKNSTEYTVIPDITAVPGYHYVPTNVPLYAPAGGFLIEQPLNGWSYTYNGIQTNYLDKNTGAKPYWASIFSDKDENTKSKGIYTWGYPNDWVDGYIPHHIPRLTPLKLQYGNVLEYERNGSSFWWTQPLVFKSFIGTSIWSALDFGTNISNLSSIFETENVSSLTAFATTSASDILLTNNIDGTPVTILYYALSSFTWSLSTLTVGTVSTPAVELYFKSQLPQSNLSNRFYPTIATIPTLEYLYSQGDVGGYFIPQNLGASQFINKDFTVTAPISSALSAQYIVEDTNVHIGGRGLTKQNQNTIYDWSENNLWIKESSTTGKLAGFVKKDLTKKFQTFIPYQSNAVESSIGLVTPQSRTTPWGGPYNEEWTDKANEPKGFTGVRNVSAWSDLQVLKQNGKVADNWVTDVYGNQYGLFKQLSGLSISERTLATGELWVRTNKQVTSPAYIALSSIFSYIPSTFYTQITSLPNSYSNPQEYLKLLYGELASSIISIDCFFDTLMIQTPISIIIAKITYDYETDQISTTFDNMRGYFGFPDYALFYNNNALLWHGEAILFDQHTF